MNWIFIVALRNLLQARRRTALLLTGLALVTFMLVTLQAFSRSVGQNLLRAATTLSSGHVNIAGFTKNNPNEAAAYIDGRMTLRQIVIDNVKDLDFVIDRPRGWATLSSETDSLQTGVSGIDINEEGRLGELLMLAEEGSYVEGGSDKQFGNIMDLAQKDAVVIFAAQAKQLGVRVGDRLTLISTTPDGLTNTLDLKVVAIAADISMMSAWSIFVNKSAVHELYRLPDSTTGAVEIHLKHPERAGEVMAHLKTVLEAKGYRIMEYASQPFWMKFDTVSGEDWIGQKLDLTLWQDEVSYIVWILKVVDGVSFLLVGILLAIIGVGVANTMWIAVRERTPEIGTLRAIGMSGRRVLAMFLLEAALLGLAATLLGALLGAGVSLWITAADVPLPKGPLRDFLMSETVKLYISWPALIWGVVVITLVTVAASLLPAVRAARLQPVTAIHHID